MEFFNETIYHRDYQMNLVCLESSFNRSLTIMKKIQVNCAINECLVSPLHTFSFISGSKWWLIWQKIDVKMVFSITLFFLGFSFIPCLYCYKFPFFFFFSAWYTLFFFFWATVFTLTYLFTHLFIYFCIFIIFCH